MTNDEKMKSKERVGHGFRLLQIALKIKWSSLASRHNTRPWGFDSGAAVAIIRSQNLVSRDSFLQMLIR